MKKKNLAPSARALDYAGRGIDNPLDAADFAELEGVKAGIAALKKKRAGGKSAKSKQGKNRGAPGY